MKLWYTERIWVRAKSKLFTLTDNFHKTLTTTITQMQPNTGNMWICKTKSKVPHLLANAKVEFGKIPIRKRATVQGVAGGERLRDNRRSVGEWEMASIGSLCYWNLGFFRNGGSGGRKRGREWSEIWGFSLLPTTQQHWRRPKRAKPHYRTNLWGRGK